MSDSSTITEADILADVLEAEGGDLSPEVARSVLRWQFTDRAKSRMTKLADRNNRGTIRPEEREELDKYLRVGSFLNLIQAKARLSLKDHESIA
jgi:hypothetical protein